MIIRLIDGLEKPSTFIKHPNIHSASETIVICNNCKREKYCSSFCEKEAFQNYHQFLCPSTPDLDNLYEFCKSLETKFPLMILRIYTKLIGEINQGITKVEYGNEASLSGGSWEFIVRLNSQIDVIEVDTIKEELDLISKILNYHPIVNQKTYITLKAACQRNASFLNIQTEYLTNFEFNQIKTTTKFPEHGLFISFMGVFLNHSCEPNVSANPQDNHLIKWSALRPIHYNEELTTSYINIDHNQNLEDRREALFENWGFWCSCKRCLREELEQKG